MIPVPLLRAGVDMTKKYLIYLAAFIVFGCIKVKNNNDKNGIETVNQVKPQEWSELFSINFNIEAKKVEVGRRSYCSDFMPLQKVSWDLPNLNFIGKGISLLRKPRN